MEQEYQIENIELREKQHCKLYKKIKGVDLDLTNPTDLNEKLQWLMIYRYDKNVSLFADKLAVRDYVRACGYGDTLPRIYAVGKSAKAVVKKTEETAAERFMLKCNHGSGPMFYSSDFSASELEKLDKSLKLDFSNVGFEYHYSYIEPYVYSEQYLGDNMTDYKFFCFGGKAMFVKVIADRTNGVHQDYFDAEGRLLDWVKDEVSISGAGKSVSLPSNFDSMLDMASTLSEPFPMARVDLYNVGGKIYFGEITLTPATGLNRTDKPQTLIKLGELTDLTYFKEDLLEFKRTDEISRLTVGMDCETRTALLKNAAYMCTNRKALLACTKADADLIMSDCCRIIGGDFDNELKSAYLNVLYLIAFREDMSLEECWQIYWNINRALFVNFNLQLNVGKLDELYRYIFEFVKSNIDYSGKILRQRKDDKPFTGKCDRTQNESTDCSSKCDKSNRQNKRVVMVTNQFLREGHAPTRRVLDYSYTLQHDLGYSVTIINEAGMHYYENDALAGVVTFNFIDEYSSLASYEYRGERFEFLQIPGRMPNLGVLQQLVDIIYEINPVLVYNIGASCLTSDLCDDFATVVTLPCSFDLPISVCSNLLIGRELERVLPASGDGNIASLSAGNSENILVQNSQNILVRLPAGHSPLLASQRVIETVFNYDFKTAAESYTREQFTIPEGVFLMCSVGHRLGEEIGKEFINCVAKALCGDPDIWFAIVGKIDDKEAVLSMIDDEFANRCKDRIVFTGALSGASSFIKLADLTLNPDRSGGGRAAFEGYYYGKPSVSLRKGDAYYAGGVDFGVDSYSEYTDTILKYASDKVYYSEMSEKAKVRAGLLGDMTATQKKMLEEVFGGE